MDTQHTKSGYNYAYQVTNHNNSENKSNISGTRFVSSIKKNMIIEAPLATHSLTSLSLTHTNQDQTSKNNNSLWRTLGSQELDDTEMGL